MQVVYLTRPMWDTSGAARLGHVVPERQFRGLAVHHTVLAWHPAPSLAETVERAKGYMRRLRTIRPDLGLDVPYSFVVFRTADPSTAIVAEGRGWARTGAHTAGHNSSRYGVAFAGNATVDPVPPSIVEAIRWVGERIVDQSRVLPTIGHRDVKATECQGNRLYALMPQYQPPFVGLRAPAQPIPPTPGGFTVSTAAEQAILAVKDCLIDQFPAAGGRGHNHGFAIQNANGKLAVLEAKLDALAGNVGAVRQAAERAATGAEVAAIVKGQIDTLVAALDGLSLEGRTVTREEVRQLLIELLTP